MTTQVSIWHGWGCGQANSDKVGPRFTVLTSKKGISLLFSTWVLRDGSFWVDTYFLRCHFGEVFLRNFEFFLLPDNCYAISKYAKINAQWFYCEENQSRVQEKANILISSKFQDHFST